MEPVIPVVETPVEELIVPVTVPVVPEPLPELRYEYQPQDENGRAMGGRQVIIYRTQDELRDKLVHQNTLVLRQLRKVTREKYLGDNEQMPDDAEKFTGVEEFKPRELSAEERFKLSQRLSDPETFEAARDELIESALGAKPSKVTETLNEANKFMIQSRAVDNYISFVNSATEYLDSQENRGVLTRWMTKNGLAPTVGNFNRAYSKLKEAGLLQDAPVVQQAPVPQPTAVVPVEEEPKPQVPAAELTRISEPPQPQEKRHSHVPSGLNESNSSATGSLPVGGPSLTLADIDKLPADVYKAKLRDPAFVKLVNQLEDDAAKRRRARQVGQV